MGRHRQFNENEALEAALSVFWQKGYEGASLEDLTQATGVARPGLYSAFGNKEKIFLRALDLYDATYMGFMREALNEPTSREVVARILRESASVQTASAAHPGCLGSTARWPAPMMRSPFAASLFAAAAQPSRR